MRAHPGILGTYINVTSRNAAKGALLTNSNDGNAGFCLGMPNAVPEWQAESLMWHSRKLVVACPLEGLVRQASHELYPVQ